MSDQDIERELKFADVDHGLLRDRLSVIEAELQGSSTLEDNWLFDSERRLAEKGSILRLRVDRHGSHLAFKGPARFEDRIKIRTEYQVAVKDFETTKRLLEALGFFPVRRYQKYRENWFLGSVVISLDHTPIGDFVEFEGEGCEKVARRSGFDPDHAERRDYMRLYEDYLKKHPDAPPDMVFP